MYRTPSIPCSPGRAQVGAEHGEAALSAWPSGEPAPEQAAAAVLKYLEDEGLTTSQQRRLEGVALLPVANATRLAAPGELFVRLPADLAPLLFEAGATLCCYGCHAALLIVPT